MNSVLPDIPCTIPTPRWKRILDCAIILLALPILVPLTLLLAVLIKLSSPGPVLFSQTRIGRGGQPFKCFKFRTMRPNACSSGHEKHLETLMNSAVPMTKLDREGDSRIIFGGRLLRSSGLDELPQLINVLRGDMSIVGPRPCLPYEFALYNDRHKQRLAVVPGITGLWQVSGKNNTTFEEMIDLDVAYARQLSPVRDLSIILRTAGVLLRQLGETIHRPRAASIVKSPTPARERV
jgi:lipopolysaccharide/colanic/teichoic acid biosynthesis glycosyltransferase